MTNQQLTNSTWGTSSTKVLGFAGQGLCQRPKEAQDSHDSDRAWHHFGVWIRVLSRVGCIASCTIPQSPVRGARVWSESLRVVEDADVLNAVLINLW